MAKRKELAQAAKASAEPMNGWSAKRARAARKTAAREQVVAGGRAAVAAGVELQSAREGVEAVAVMDVVEWATRGRRDEWNGGQ